MKPGRLAELATPLPEYIISASAIKYEGMAFEAVISFLRMTPVKVIISLSLDIPIVREPLIIRSPLSFTLTTVADIFARSDWARTFSPLPLKEFLLS